MPTNIDLARIIRWIAATIATIVAISMPLGYWVLAYEFEVSTALIEAEAEAAFVTQRINVDPDMWRFEVPRLDAILATNLSAGELPEVRYILDERGTLLAQSAGVLSPPILTRSAALFDAGRVVGRFVVSRSLVPLIRNTGAAALIALALAMAVYISLSVLPLRALEHTLAMLRHEQEHLRVVVDNAVDGIMTLDPRGTVESFNPAAARMFGHPLAEIIGRGIANIMPELPLIEPRTNPNSYLGTQETIGRRRDGATFPVELATSQAVLRGGVKFIVIARDITERKRAEQTLVYMANYDTLTGLPNRNLFRDRLRQATLRATRNNKLVALLYLDLDQFKTVNDSLGHAIGDVLLKQVAQRLTERLRRSDTISRLDMEQVGPEENANVTISRLGGDEFTVTLEDIANVEHIAAAAQRLLTAFAPPFQLENHEIYITASIGIAVYPNDGADLDKLIGGADAAMYQAKEQGRNNFQFFTPAMGARARQRLEFEVALRRALERGEFSLHYQPKLDLGNGHVTGMEALLRWNHPELGSVSPARFVPVLEDTGLIIPVGEWVLRSACAQVKKWQAKGLPALRVSVNISARQFVKEKLVAGIAQILEDTELAPDLLEVEMTEGLLMVHSEASAAVLSALKALGIHISVDDFGTGYSSLSYLKRFPVDVLKIDQSFVRDINTDPDDAAIVRAIIALAHGLRLRTIAEGVETKAQLGYLRAEGCDEIQGYLLSRPLTADAFEEWISAGIDYSKRPPFSA